MNYSGNISHDQNCHFKRFNGIYLQFSKSIFHKDQKCRFRNRVGSDPNPILLQNKNKTLTESITFQPRDVV